MATAASSAPSKAPSTPGSPWTLWTPHVSWMLSLEHRKGCGEHREQAGLSWGMLGPCPGTGVLGPPKAAHREEPEAKWRDQTSQEPCDESPKGGDQHLPSHTHHGRTSHGGILDLDLMEQDMGRGLACGGHQCGAGGIWGFLGLQTGS